MKAKEIYEKYRPLIFEVPDGLEWKISQSERIVHTPKTDEEFDSVIHQMWCEVLDEVNALLKQRKVRTDKAFLGVVNEINDKYNAVRNMFERDFGMSPIKRDGVKTEILRWVSEKNNGKENN